MNPYHYSWLLLLCWLSANSAVAQQDWQHLLKEVHQSIKQEPQKGIHLKYTQTLVAVSKEKEPQIATVELLQQGQQQYKKTDQVIYLADEQHAFAIYPTAKKIFVLQAWKKTQQQLQQAGGSRDIQQLWEGANIQEIPAQKVGHCRVQIIPTKAMQQLGQVVKIELEYDCVTHVLHQSKLYLPPHTNYAYMLYDYTYVHKAKQLHLFENAQAEVFTSQGKLLKKYQGFAVEQR